MKNSRKFLTLLLFLASFTGAFAQWSGTNPLTTSSNVNISSPGNDAKLDVGGAGDSATLQITSPGFTQTGYIGPLRIRQTVYIPTSGGGMSTQYGPMFCIAPNGYMGVKTENPT